MHTWKWLPVLLLLGALTRAEAAPPTPEELLPANTTGFVSIANLTKLEQGWKETQLAKLLADPNFKPFMDEVVAKTKGSNYLLDTIGVSWDTFKNAGGGQLGWGLVLASPTEVAHVLTLDMNGRSQSARDAFFIELGKQLQGQCAQLSQRQQDGMNMIVAELPNNRQIIYGIKAGVMVCTDHWGTLQGILARWTGAANNSLVSQQPFQMVQQRTRPHPGETAQIHWYFVPLLRAEAEMIFKPELKKVKGDNLVQVLRKEGVDAIRGVGGSVALASNGTDMLVRMSAFAPQPYVNAMRMAKLPNETLDRPEPWVPADVSTWATISLDLLNAFDTFDTVFERLADEPAGTFKEIIKSLKDDPDGPRVDVRREIFEQVTNRITFINDALVPVSPKGERFLFAVPAKSSLAATILAEGIRKCFENDRRFKTKRVNGALVWEYHPRPKKGQPVTLPTTAITVANGTLFISTHGDLLEKVLTQGNKPGLAAAPDFQRFMSEMVRLGMGPSSHRFFARVEDGARTTYEMMRAGRLAEVESAYAHILLAFVKLDADGKRLRIDGSKLPPYEKVAPYLDLIGSYSFTHDDGWSLVGVGLKR